MDSVQRVEGLTPSSKWGDYLQAYGLLNLDTGAVKDFFERVPELFDKCNHFVPLLYKIVVRLDYSCGITRYLVAHESTGNIRSI